MVGRLGSSSSSRLDTQQASYVQNVCDGEPAKKKKDAINQNALNLCSREIIFSVCFKKLHK